MKPNRIKLSSVQPKCKEKFAKDSLSEHRIKELKLGIRADRLSCHDFLIRRQLTKGFSGLFCPTHLVAKMKNIPEKYVGGLLNAIEAIVTHC